jgi:small GTP-binding protein
MSKNEKEKTETIIYKVLILGNSSVGKTSFLVRFSDDKFDPETLTTVGVDYKTKFIKRNNKNVKLQICDTAGQERFRTIAKNLYRNADGIIIMYDISNKKSFQDIKDWIGGINENLDSEKLGLVICGNKTDLKDKRQVNEDMRKDLEEKRNIKVIEASAKDNINVNETFIELLEQMEKLNLGIKNYVAYGEDEENEESGSMKLKNEKVAKGNNGNCCSKK